MAAFNSASLIHHDLLFGLRLFRPLLFDQWLVPERIRAEKFFKNDACIRKRPKIISVSDEQVEQVQYLKETLVFQHVLGEREILQTVVHTSPSELQRELVVAVW